ncbi:MAG: cytochrome P450 [Pseudomonadota bacterium]
MSSLVSAARTAAAPRHPPGPRGLPIIGCLLSVLRNPMQTMAKAARQFGGIVRIPIRGKFLYLVSEPDLLRELLVTNRDKYMKNIRYRHIQALVGQGMLLSEAAEWRRQRLITQPEFKPDHIDAQVGWMTELTDKFLERWRVLADRGEAIDVEPEFARLAQLLAGRYLLGPGFDAIADRFCKVAAECKEHWPLAPRGLVALFKKPAKEKLAAFDAAIAELDACIYGYITEHRKTGFKDCGVLTRLVASQKDGQPEFTDTSLRDQISTLFFAGHETSATAMCWIHYLLFKHGAVRNALQLEVADVLGNRMATAAELRKLQYTSQVIDESMRLYSPIHAISRVAMQDDTVGGYHIPAGQTIVMSMYATHRLPQYWPDPERFDPTRFEPAQVAARSRFAYFPFAAGHRNCVGAAQALVELKLVIARIAQRYTLELVPGQKIEPAPGTTMYPRHGMKMTIHHRTQA